MARCQARFRGEAWELSLQDWFKIWEHAWPLRGRQAHSVNLFRINTLEPWSRSNCELRSRWSTRPARGG